MKFTRRGGQHGMDGTPPGRLQRSHGDAAEECNSETSDIEHRPICGSFPRHVNDAFTCLGT